MHITWPHIVLGAFSFRLVAARPLAEDGPSNLALREANPDNNLVYRQAPHAQFTSIVYENVIVTTTDYFTITTTIGGPEPIPSVKNQPVQSRFSQLAFSEYSKYIPGIPSQVIKSTAQAPQAASTATKSVAAAPPGAAPPAAASPAAASPAAVSPAAATSSAASGSTSGGSGSSGKCTTGDPQGNLGFHLTNAGSVDATYYIYASVDAKNTSETVPWGCAEVNTGQTIFVAIPPGLNGRIMRGLPYSQTTDHPSRGPASWFEFNHNTSTTQIWSDISLIQGYDGAIFIEGSDGVRGFNQTLPMSAVSLSYTSALMTKTGYPSNIPAPTVIGPTVAMATMNSNMEAYNFYVDGFPGGPCKDLQVNTYVSNYPTYNPNYQSADGDLRIFNVTFYEGII